MLDILIRKSTIVDGTGKPAFQADVGIAGGRIVLLKNQIDQDAFRIIDAQTLHLAPGFIDPHSHSDLPLLANPLAESKIRQGVTTEVNGNCGFSPAPIRAAANEEMRSETSLLGVKLSWRDMAEYLEQLRHPGTAVNVVTLVGHNTIRGSVLGYGDVQPSPEQQSEMENLVANAMEQGARGMSTGLFFPPGMFSTTDEVIGLARIVAQHGGIYVSHIRNESDRIFEAVDEAIRIGQEAGIRVEISHLKLEGFRNWDGTEQLLTMLDNAHSRGVQLGCDQYPYTAGASWLFAILPHWAQVGGTAAVGSRLDIPEIRTQLRKDWEQNRAQWEERGGMRDWSDILVTDCASRPEVLGKSISEIAEIDSKDPLEVAFDLMVISKGNVACVFFTQIEENVRTLMRHPLVAIGSDGAALSPYGILGKGHPHPRSYGTYPRILGQYVRDEHVIQLEEAVKKMTSMTAERFGLTDRGIIREGAWADLVLFDAQTVIDKATYVEPNLYPEGIPFVLVNGEIVVDRGQHTCVRPGQIL